MCRSSSSGKASNVEGAPWATPATALLRTDPRLAAEGGERNQRPPPILALPVALITEAGSGLTLRIGAQFKAGALPGSRASQPLIALIAALFQAEGVRSPASMAFIGAGRTQFKAGTPGSNRASIALIEAGRRCSRHARQRRVTHPRRGDSTSPVDDSMPRGQKTSAVDTTVARATTAARRIPCGSAPPS